MSVVYIFAMIMAIYFVLNYYRTRKFRELMKVARNGIRSVPVIGVAYHLIGSNVTKMKALQNFGLEANKCGGVAAVWFGPLPYVVISDAVVADVVLKECLEKDNVMNIVRSVIGNSTIVAPVPVWRIRRRVIVPTFISRNLRQFVGVFSKQSHVMVEQLKKHVGGGPFPMWKYLATNNMDTLCETVFGVEMNVQKNSEHPFWTNFNESMSIMAARLCQPWLHNETIYKLLPQYQIIKRGQKICCDIVDEIIEQKRKDMEENKYNKDGRRSFLELLIESSAQEDGPYNNEVLREETMALTIAGPDTTAAGAAFVLLALSRYQDVQEKVYQEMKEVFGDSTKDCTMDDLKKLAYMEAAIKEAMRLYTPVPVVLRKVTRDVTLPSGLILPAGCGVLMNIWALHRNQKYWGEDAEVFRPERFLNATFKHPAQYMPFSYGPRNCPGGRYAMLSLKMALATLLHQYRVLPASAGEPRLSFELMMKDADEFKVQIELRKLYL